MMEKCLKMWESFLLETSNCNTENSTMCLSCVPRLFLAKHSELLTTSGSLLSTRGTYLFNTMQCKHQNIFKESDKLHWNCHHKCWGSGWYRHPGVQDDRDHVGPECDLSSLLVELGQLWRGEAEMVWGGGQGSLQRGGHGSQLPGCQAGQIGK